MMKNEDFIQLLVKEIGIRNHEITVSTELETIYEWDSMAVMIVISVVNKNLGIKLKSKDFDDLITMDDLIHKIKYKLSH